MHVQWKTHVQDLYTELYYAINPNLFLYFYVILLSLRL